MIKILQLNKNYGKKAVLSNLDMEIETNKCTAIMGKSGEGKTTLLRILMGLEKPTSGEICNIPSKKSAVFQENRLCDTMSVIKNIQLVNSQLTESEILTHLQSVGMGENLHEKVSKLSGGMKRRVAIVRAMLANYDIMFLDEPFKGLDEETKIQTMTYVKEQTKNKTTLLITHDKAEQEFFNANLIQL